jgi:hypothetical protein
MPAAAWGLIQLLREKPSLNVIGRHPKDDKQAGLSRHQGRFEAGRFLLPIEAPWLADFENELLAFPSGRYDDQVDALLLFLDWFAANEDSITVQSCRPDFYLARRGGSSTADQRLVIFTGLDRPAPTRAGYRVFCVSSVSTRAASVPCHSQFQPQCRPGGQVQGYWRTQNQCRRLVLPASASLTRRRIASEREGLSGSRLAQSSICNLSVGDSRTAVTGSCPVLGRPRFFVLRELTST